MGDRRRGVLKPFAAANKTVLAIIKKRPYRVPRGMVGMVDIDDAVERTARGA